MAHRVLRAADAFWRPSNQMKVENTDIGKQLEAGSLGARFWRLRPGQASTKHRHLDQAELYVVIEGTGRMRVDEEPLTLEVHSAVLVDPDSVRQLFNDTDSEALWLVVGAPPEVGNTLEMSEELIATLYPDGPQALPPELSAGGDQARGSARSRSRWRRAFAALPHPRIEHHLRRPAGERS